MAYYRPRKRPENAQNTENAQEIQFPGAGDIWDTIKAPMAGLWQGIVPRTLGGNLTFEEHLRRKRRKLPNRRQNWLGRIIGK